MTGWDRARAAGRLPTRDSLTPAEQLARVRDLCADWDSRLSDPKHNPYASELARALGVGLGLVGRPTPEPDPLPEPEEVPCQHDRADGVCTLCGDAPLFPVGYDMPPLPTAADAAERFWAHYDRTGPHGAGHRRAAARVAAWQELTTAEQYVLGNPPRRHPSTKEPA